MQKIYYGDFETSKLMEYDKVTKQNVVKKARVYLWVLLKGEEVYHGESITTFMDKLKSMKKCVIFFHNLKFDFSYMLPYLLKHNIKFKILEKNDVIYSVKFFNIELRDSMNFLPMELKKVGENYCHVYQKTSIDYDVDYNHRPNRMEIQYCINDCRVCEEGLGNYLSELENVLKSAGANKSATKVWKKLTNAGISFEAFKELSQYEELCPRTTKSEYELLREAYRGGYVFSKPCGIQRNIQMIDCNSMYPFMYSSIDMPFGKGIKCRNEEELNNYKFFVICIRATYELKPGKIAIIGGGLGKFGSIVYKASSGGEEEILTLSNKDFELVKKFYDIEYSFVWGMGFETKKEFFKRYADTFIAIKNREQGIRRAIAKILLNSPYGKTAENGFEEIYKYSLDEDDEVVKELVGYSLEEERYQYLPIAIAITSSARFYLLTTAEEIGFENVLYMDTDSIKFFDRPVSFKFDPNELGAWKDEGKAVLFKTIAPKKYGYFDGEKIFFKCAGFNQKTLERDLKNEKEVSFDEALELLNKFDKGLELFCLQSHLVPGGRALVDIKKEIK